MLSKFYQSNIEEGSRESPTTDILFRESDYSQLQIGNRNDISEYRLMNHVSSPVYEAD